MSSADSRYRAGSFLVGSRVALGPLCEVLREDPDLAATVPRADRDRAIDDCTAPVVRIPRGHWDGERSDVGRGGVGLLVLQGLLLRRVGADGHFGAEILGDGDLLRPWHEGYVPAAMPYRTHWSVLEPTRVAVLDGRAAERLGRYPGLIEGLVGRALGRARELAINMAIVQHPRVDIRLLMLLWHFADRWARVRRDGVYLPLPLTHAVLGELVAARRPTVTRALSKLAQQGLVRNVDEVWLLSGEPPAELLELRAAVGPSVPSGNGHAGGCAETRVRARQRDGFVRARAPRGTV